MLFPGLNPFGTPVQRPVCVFFDGIHEGIGDTNRIVGVLTGNRTVGFGVPIGVIFIEIHINIPLFGKVNDALYIVLLNLGLSGVFNDPLQFKVLFRGEAIIGRFPFPDGGK